MATSTLVQLRDRVTRDRFDVNTYQSRVDGWLNEAQGRVARRADVPTLQEAFSFSTEVGVWKYPLPTNFARGLFLLPVDGLTGELDWVEDQIEIVRQARRAQGRPTCWNLSGAILLGPTPDAPYGFEMTYQRLPAPLLSDSGTPEIPEDYADMLVTYAVAKCYRAEDDDAAGAKWMADFENDLSGLKVDLREASYDGPVQIGGTFTGGSYSSRTLGY